MTVLIVDDNAAMRALIRSILPRRTYRVYESQDGLEAQRSYERFHPDVVLMDVEMATMDGIHATRQLRRSHPEAKVIMVTNHVDERTRRAAQQAGAVGFISKEELMTVTEVLRALR